MWWHTTALLPLESGEGQWLEFEASTVSQPGTHAEP